MNDAKSIFDTMRIHDQIMEIVKEGSKYFVKRELDKDKALKSKENLKKKLLDKIAELDEEIAVLKT